MILPHNPSPRAWDLKALKAGREVLCSLPGQLPQEGGPPHASRESTWGVDRDAVHRLAMLEECRSSLLLCKGDHRSEPGTEAGPGWTGSREANCLSLPRSERGP